LDQDDPRSPAASGPNVRFSVRRRPIHGDHRIGSAAQGPSASALATLIMNEIFSTERSFADLGLDEHLLTAIGKLGFEHPTLIQAELIPVALEGRDILGQAKTGTGKTAAFGLPMLQMLGPDADLGGLVLVPTRELALQVAAELEAFAGPDGPRVVAIYGGHSIKTQAQHLAKRPAIVVGTPGRIMDMRQRNHLPYERFRMVVLDEVDRMLDIGFRDDIRRILGGIPGKPQTIFVSATISPEIDRLARNYMRDPVKITSTTASLTVSQVSQSYLSVESWDKTRLLVHLLTHEAPGLTVVFCRTKRTVDNVAAALTRANIDAHAMHGDMFQTKRNKVMAQLRAGSLKVVVASDLASRGLDVDDITHVVNYDLPEDPEVYVHRIGRTARAGRDGTAWSFVTPEQGELLTSIEMLINFEIPRKDYSDFTPGPVPSDVQSRREAEARRLAEPRRGRTSSTSSATLMDESSRAALFPGGLVPSATPGRRMGGRVPTRRR